VKSPVLNGELSLLLGVHDPEKVGDLISVDQICPLFPELGRTSAGPQGTLLFAGKKASFL